MKFSYSGSMEIILWELETEYGPSLQEVKISSPSVSDVLVSANMLKNILGVMRDYKTFFAENWSEDRLAKKTNTMETAFNQRISSRRGPDPL